MSDPTTDSRFLELFPAWLRSLGEDAAALGQVVEGDGRTEVERYAVAGLNYLFKSLDLIPDGVDDIGYLDDAFVLRVAAENALRANPERATPALTRLASDAAPLREFLGEDYARLDAYVQRLRKGAARGRSVEEILVDSGVRTSFVHEVTAWSRAYAAPSFTRDKKTLIKLKAFLSAKLS